MKSVLISIQPKWCELIASGKKTVEVRKTRPKLQTPFRCYIYCTKGRPLLTFTGLVADNGQKQINVNSDTHSQPSKNEVLLNGKVIGEFVCDKIDQMSPDFNPITKQFFYNNDWHNNNWNGSDTCLSTKELNAYGKGATLYGWHISDLKIYDKPKELGEFYNHCNAKYDSRKCWDCLNNGYQFIKNCLPYCKVNRPSQSWCYVEANNG